MRLGPLRPRKHAVRDATPSVLYPHDLDTGDLVEVAVLGIDRYVEDARGRRDQRVEDLGPPTLPTSLVDDLRELASHVVVHRERRQRFDLRQGAHPLGAHRGIGGNEHADATLSERDYRNPSLRGKLAQRPFVLAGKEHRGVETRSKAVDRVTDDGLHIGAKRGSSGASRTMR